MMERLMLGLLVLLLLVWMLVPFREAEALHPLLGFDLEKCRGSQYPGHMRSPMRLAQCFEQDPIRIAVTWADQQGEIGYHVSGSIGYHKVSCEPEYSITPKGGGEFSEVLPPNTTWFRLPEPEDEGANFVKEYYFQIRAVDRNGDVLAGDGTGAIMELWGACPQDESSRAPGGPAAGGTGA